MEENIASKVFKRELFTCFCIYYFPVMILMCMVVLGIDYLKRNIAVTGPLLCLLFPAIVSVAMAFIRVKIVWGLEYKPNWKNQALFLTVVSLMFLIEKVSYTVLQQPDFAGIVFFSLLLLIAIAWYKFSKENVEYENVAKMLVLVSAGFIFLWFVFVIIVRAAYSMIVLLSWISLFLFNLRFVLRRQR